MTRKQAPTPAADKREALSLVLQDELRTLHEHVVQGTDYEVFLIAYAFDRKTGEGTNVRKANVENIGIAVSIVKSLRKLADELEGIVRRDRG